MKYTISELTHTPKVGAIDANGVMHYELDITEASISWYPTAYNASNGTIQRVLNADPIFTYNYNTTQYTDSHHEITLAIPQDE